MNKNKILYMGSMIVILMAVVILGYVYWLTFYPFKIVEFTKFEVKEQTVTAGDTITLDMEFVKHHDFKPDITFYIVDGVSYVVPLSGIVRNTGTNKTERDIKIPEAFVGEYHIEVAITYHITPFREINYVIESNEFTVISSK